MQNNAATSASPPIDWFDIVEPANLAKHPMGRYRGYIDIPEWTTPAMPGANLEINVLVGTPDAKFPAGHLHVMVSIADLRDDAERNGSVLVLDGALIWFRPFLGLGRKRWMLIFDQSKYSIELQADPEIAHRLATAAQRVIAQLVRPATSDHLEMCFEEGVFASPWDWGKVRHTLVEHLGYEVESCPCCTRSRYFHPGSELATLEP